LVFRVVDSVQLTSQYVEKFEHTRHVTSSKVIVWSIATIQLNQVSGSGLALVSIRLETTSKGALFFGRTGSSN